MRIKCFSGTQFLTVRLFVKQIVSLLPFVTFLDSIPQKSALSEFISELIGLICDRFFFNIVRTVLLYLL